MFSYATKSRGVQPSSSATDPNFKQVSVLLHGDGTNGAQNNTFLDSSTNNFSITRVGTTTQGTYTPFSQDAGYWSNYFDGTNDRLTIADNANLRAGTSAFTLEAWVYRNAAGVAHTIFAKGAATPTGFVFGITSANTLRFTDTSTNIDSTGTISANTWTYVAVVREGTGSNQCKLYINGVNDGTGTSATNFNQTTEARIGENRGATEDFNGYISNLRFVIGTAVYTANFTPSTIPLTAITNTSLLTCQSNRFVDNSSNNFTLTPTGTPSVQPWSPFAPTSAYSTSVNGGSLYFNGTTDYLTLPASSTLQLGTNNFTMEGWFYITSFVNQNALFYIDGGTNGFGVRLNVTGSNNGFLSMDFSSNGTTNVFSTTSSVSVGLNQWVHLAYVRNGSAFNGYINGVSVISNTSALSANTGTNHAIGARLLTTYAQFLTGYASNVRIVNGTAVYTANFTPPTAPLTAITNTVLLLSGTNAGVYDNAGKNNLITASNPKLSTAQVKYGTASVLYALNSNAMTVPLQPYITLGTANFTVEFWVYFNSTATSDIIDWRTTGTQAALCIQIVSGNALSVYVSNVIRITGSALSTGQWYHVAVTRSGTNTRLFVNGTQQGSTWTTDSTNYLATPLGIGAYLPAPNNSLGGYLDDIRITNGIARYTTTFTPPSQPFPNQ